MGVKVTSGVGVNMDYINAAIAKEVAASVSLDRGGDGQTWSEPSPPRRRRKGRAKRSPVPKEKDVQKAVLLYLRSVGAFAVRINSGAVVGEYRGKRRFVRFNDVPGCFDTTACVRGRFVAIEIKRPGGKATPKQLAALDAVRRAGGLAFVASSVAEVERALKAEGLA